MLFHAFPRESTDPFLLGMLGVKSAHKSFVEALKNNSIKNLKSISQERNLEIRYSKMADFTDDVAGSYLKNLPSGDKVLNILRGRDMRRFINPYIDKTE
jgi:hypothetical protein